MNVYICMMQKYTTQCNTYIILLAAGASVRMGQPKQLLPIGEQPLLLHTLSQLLPLSCPIIVVLGAFHEQISPLLYDSPVEVVVNTHWQQGMGSSMKAGLSMVQTRAPGVSSVLFVVVDQPKLNTALLENMLECYRQHPQPAGCIVAAQYSNGTLGVPALFGKGWFASLHQLNNEAGAGVLIRSQQATITPVSFPEGEWDLDFPSDYFKWKNEDFV
ncbi:MAG: nucleotidyltransferase family protein [Saprospiraceae bacterium]